MITKRILLVLLCLPVVNGCTKSPAPAVAPKLEAPVTEIKATANPTEVTRYSILHWNVESGGNNPATIAAQLIDLGRYDIVGLSEVNDPEPYVDAITQKYSDDFDFIRGNTGNNNGRDNDRLLIYFDKARFELLESADMDEAGGVKLNNGRHRSPLYARLKDRSSGQELIVIQNHLARGNATLISANSKPQGYVNGPGRNQRR